MTFSGFQEATDAGNNARTNAKGDTDPENDKASAKFTSFLNVTVVTFAAIGTILFTFGILLAIDLCLGQGAKQSSNE